MRSSVKRQLTFFLYQLLFIVGLSLLTFSCSNGEDQQASELQKLASKKETNFSKGKQLLETKCYVCHNPKLTEDQLIAPPMVAVKAAYNFDTEKAFISAFKSWLKHPEASKSRMPEAIDKYGLMPYQAFNEETIEAISKYIFHNKIEEPNWWNNASNQTNTDAIDKNETTLEKGVAFALQTKMELGKNLMSKLKNEGPTEAVKFCAVHALPITDSMSNQLGTTIQRVTNKSRNPLNKANEFENQLIASYEEQLVNNEELAAVEHTVNGQSVVYYPIQTNAMCLKCHGTPNKTISPEVLSTIQKHYPSDKALNYKVNQIRGMWKVTFP